jgi:hypothetical protein
VYATVFTTDVGKLPYGIRLKIWNIGKSVKQNVTTL